MKIMFMGTPEFAVPSLLALYNEKDFEVCAVVTNPDRPKGRGHKMVHSPVYETASEHNTPIYQPQNLKKENFEKILNEVNPDMIAVVAFGMLLPEYVLNYPKYGCINVHGSLLPKYRGAAPMQWCVINGETKTGITTMYMGKGLDTGDMLLKEECDILPDDTYEDVHNKLTVMGASLLVTTIKGILNGTVIRIPQIEQESTYVSIVDKSLSVINWENDANKIHNLVRGLYPYPKAQTTISGKQLKILKTKVCTKSHTLKNGAVMSAEKDGLFVACGKNTVLEILTVQPEGKKPMDVNSYLLGNKIEKNTVLGVD